VLKSLEIKATIVDGDYEIGSWYTEIALDEGAIESLRKNDDTFDAMALPVLWKIREALGIEDPTVRETREIKEALDAGKSNEEIEKILIGHMACHW